MSNTPQPDPASVAADAADLAADAAVVAIDPEAARVASAAVKAGLDAKALANAITSAARELAVEKVSSDENLAAVKLAADDKREQRSFFRDIILQSLVALPIIITAWRVGTQSVEIAEVKKTGEATHDLANSNMTAQLKISAVALRTIADMKATPEAKAAAELAEKMLYEHEANQGKVK